MKDIGHMTRKDFEESGGTCLECLADDRDRKRILFELYLAVLELRIVKQITKIDYRELKFPLPAFIISHPEGGGAKISEICKGKLGDFHKRLCEDYELYRGGVK